MAHICTACHAEVNLCVMTSRAVALYAYCNAHGNNYYYAYTIIIKNVMGGVHVARALTATHAH